MESFHCCKSQNFLFMENNFFQNRDLPVFSQYYVTTLREKLEKSIEQFLSQNCDRLMDWQRTFTWWVQCLLYRVSPQKCTDFTMSYLEKYWNWRLQIFYSKLAWVEIVYWKIWCDYLIPLKVCWYLKISKFWAM